MSHATRPTASWFRDVLKGLLWAVCAAAVTAVVSFSGVIHGLALLVAILALAPVAAYGFHRSPRVAWLTLAWVLLLVGIFIGWVLWAFRDFQFRAIQG